MSKLVNYSYKGEDCVKQQKIISFSVGKDNLKKKKRDRKIKRIVRKSKSGKYVFLVCTIILFIYATFTSIYYINYKQCPEDWEMTSTRKNEKKCKEFRDIYKTEFESQEIRRVSNKCLLKIMQEKIDYSEILHYYIGDDGKATLEATANVELNKDFLNPFANEIGETTYRNIQVYPDYQDIIQGKKCVLQNRKWYNI